MPLESMQRAQTSTCAKFRSHSYAKTVLKWRLVAILNFVAFVAKSTLSQYLTTLIW